MRDLLLLIQYASIIGLFIESWIIFKRIKNSPLPYLFLSCLAILANNIGYLFQMLSTTEEAYITALRFSYAGRVWVTFFLFLFTIDLCKIKFPKALKCVLVIAHILIYFCILTLGQHNLYYTWTQFSDENIFPKLLHGNGIVHHIFMSMQILYIVIGFSWLFKAWRKEKNRTTKKCFMAVIISFLIECFFFTAHMLKLFEITNFYDTTIIGYVIGVVVMFVAFFRYDLLGAKEIARDFIIDHLSEGIIAVDTKGNIQYSNKTAIEMFPNIEIDSTFIIPQIKNAVMNKSVINVNNRAYIAEANDLLRDNKNFGKLYVLFDATERYEHLKKEKYNLQRELRIDPMTGLYNRKGMEYFSDILYKDALQNKKNFFVCICDMNGLKYINDNFGHEEGDRAIKTLAQIIKEASDKDDMAFRIGGDEFLILGTKDDSESALDDFAAKVEKTVSEFNQNLKLPYQISMSYGPTLQKLTGTPNEFSDLMRRSDTLMYEMKKNRDDHIRQS
ncbi:MAG: diguanylate cyclase [Treponema sp.]|nr:diguanylate cyclase [Treponema sp.]